MSRTHHNCWCGGRQKKVKEPDLVFGGLIHVLVCRRNPKHRKEWRHVSK